MTNKKGVCYNKNYRRRRRLRVITISFLGPHGTFTEEALNRLCECQSLMIQKEAMNTIDEAIEAAMLGHVDYAFVPVENSLGGTVLTTIDYLAEHGGVEIRAEICMPIRHYLWGLPGSAANEITMIYSHPQALRQCKMFLQKQAKQAQQIVTDSTAQGAGIVAQSQSLAKAAIGGEAMGIKYGLVKLTDQIQDIMLNLTRFILVKPNHHITFDATMTTGKVSLQCELEGLRPGSLWECLGIFAKRQINLVKIESRPTKGRLGEYKFFLDLQILDNGPQISEALAELKELATSLQLLGAYETYIVE